MGQRKSRRLTWRIAPRTFSDEVAHVRHFHIATEPSEQRVLAVLPLARAVVAITLW
jgi:hypothetical protein